MGIILVIAIILLFILIFVITQDDKNKRLLKHPNYIKVNESDLIRMSTYVGGHPNIDDQVLSVYAAKIDNNIVLFDAPTSMSPTIKIGTIPIDSIKSINIEDASSFNKKLSLGRVMLVGVFALAWKKNVKNENYFITIDWNDGKFDHSTIFSFEKPLISDPKNTSNKTRNKLIAICK